MVQEVANEVRDQALVGKVNVDRNPELARKYGIRGIPTFLIFDQGKVVDRFNAGSKEALLGRIEARIY